MTGSASALFGGKEETAQAEEGAPAVLNVEITTYRGVPYRAQFLSTDAEGDAVTYAVDQPPQKGTVVVDGADFTYTPDEGVTGSDSFTYTATDAAGNTSAPAEVTVTIEKIRSGVTYADMGDSAAAAAAQYLAE